jgi:SAM-dependent methyltransferase
LIVAGGTAHSQVGKMSVLGEKICLFLINTPLFSIFKKRTPTAKLVYNDDGSVRSDLNYSKELFESTESIILNFMRLGHPIPIEDSDLLDIGCGDGGRTAYYGMKGALRAVGIDRDLSRLKRAKLFCRKRGLDHKVFFSEASSHKLPFSEGSFDVIVMTDVMEHISEPLQTLLEAKRVLRPGGKLFISFGCYYTPLGSHLTDWIPLPWQQVLFSERTLIRILKKLSEDEPYILFQFPGLKKVPLPVRIDDLESGGQNRITLRTFRDYINLSGLGIELFWTPFLAKIPMVGELFAIVRCVLKKLD